MSVAAAQEASARGDWRAAYDALTPDRDHLDDAGLELLAEAAWWLGDSSTSMTVSEELFQRLHASGRDHRAADRALRLSLEWLFRGDVSIATAWRNRAARILADLPDCALHGYLAYLVGSFDLDMTGDPGPATSAAEAVRRSFDASGDPALDSFALALGGMAAVRRGETSSGFADLDEAMLPVLAGQVDPLWAGDIYCTVIHLCDDLADLSRMRAWTDALGRWSSPKPRTFMFAGVTRIHELQLVAAEGDWEAVEQELGRRSADLVGAHGWLAGEGYYTLGEVRRLRGDADGATAAYSSARELGHDAQPGAALLLRTAGRAAEALSQLRIALAGQNRLVRARILLAAVELALELHETAYAEGLAAELEETAEWYGTAGLLARAGRARGAVLLAAGDPAAAIPGLHQAAQIYREQRHQHALAAVHERLAEAHRATGDTTRADSERATAVAIYRRLGAAPDLARMTARQRPGGLTERESEVLSLVASGSSNREAADALTISAKTVSRHLENIFAKLGVTSRTAAAAWAREHDL